MVQFAFAAIALLLCSSLPVEGFRARGGGKNTTQKSTEKLELQEAQPERVVLNIGSPRSVTWRIGELVGYVKEGNIVRVGDHGMITSLKSSDMSAWVRFDNGTNWDIYLSELYKVVASEYGFTGGQRVEYVGGSNSNGVAHRQSGIVMSFSEDAPCINWWELRQQIRFCLQPSQIRAPDPYSPKRGNGAWMPLHFVVKGGSIVEKIGTTKTDSRTETASWSNQVTSTLSTSMTAGVGFIGASIEVQVGISLSSTLSHQHSSAVSYSWTLNEESIYTLPFSDNGFLWQWHIRTELDNRQVLTSKTRNFAVTTGAWEKPRCLPGYQTDGLKHQTCYNSASRLFSEWRFLGAGICQGHDNDWVQADLGARFGLHGGLGWRMCDTRSAESCMALCDQTRGCLAISNSGCCFLFKGGSCSLSSENLNYVSYSRA